MTKKEIAESFLKLVSSGKVREAYEKYVHQDFRHHNAYYKGDRESLLLAMEEAAVASPNKSLEVMRTLEDGNLVATHSRLLRVDSNAPEIAAVHIFRFEGDKIIEEWEAGQELPKDSPNENGAF
jgi:predicted SnoaL-like aldol condensation-catalyzing enzyme